MKSLRCAIASFFLFTVWTVYPYIYMMHMLQYVAPSGRELWVLGLGDFHDRVHIKTNLQRDGFEKLLQAIAECKTLVLVEDLSSPNTVSGCVGCGYLRIDTKGSFLAGLADACIKAGVQTLNLEYRFCRVAGLGPLLNRASSPNMHIQNNYVSVAVVHAEVLSQIARIKSFDDGSFLNEYYTKTIAQLYRHMTKINFDAHKKTTLSDYIGPELPQDIIKDLLMFDSALLDLEMVHAIVNATNKEIIIMVAGAAHITNVATIMEQIGYKTVYRSNVGYDTEGSDVGCRGLPKIRDQFCIKPKPLNFDQVKAEVLKWVVAKPK